MSKKLKICLYWFTVVLPVYDIVRGAIAGIVSVFQDAKDERIQQEAEQRYQEMKERFLNDNSD